MEEKRMLSVTSHAKVLIQLLSRPVSFFEGCRERFKVKNATVFLLISSLMFTFASLSLQQFQSPFIDSAVLFANAFGMVLILSTIGYAIMGISMGRYTPFKHFFSVYAYASGTTLLIAWIPNMLIFTELWRWMLIGIGLKRGCGFGTGASIWIICASLFVVTFLFKAIIPLL